MGTCLQRILQINTYHARMTHSCKTTSDPVILDELKDNDSEIVTIHIVSTMNTMDNMNVMNTMNSINFLITSFIIITRNARHANITSIKVYKTCY